jgi:hypothetical protein
MRVIARVFPVVAVDQVALEVENTSLAAGGASIESYQILAHLQTPILDFSSFALPAALKFPEHLPPFLI